MPREASQPPPGARDQDHPGDSESKASVPPDKSAAGPAESPRPERPGASEPRPVVPPEKSAEAAAEWARRGRRRDPKSVVTPDAFSVSPELLGVPLAAPRRRVGAIVLDGFLIALLEALSWRLLLGGAALGLFLALVRRPEMGRAKRTRRAARGCAAAALALAAVFATFVPAIVRQGDVSLPPKVQLVVDSISHAMQDSSAIEEAGRAPGDSLIAAGAGLAVADSLAVAASPPVAEPSPATDSPPVAEPSPATDSSPVADSVPAAADPPSTAFAWLRDIADEVGLLFGWGTVYMTLFTALWRGRTPGKRVMGLRVVRLTGEPLGLFRSFERAGGYAAGFATGLLGFARVWWDPNRQAIHDKIAETVVVRERLRRDRGGARPPERGGASPPERGGARPSPPQSR